MNGKARDKVRRSYRPTVEALEALRMLSGTATPTLPGLAVEQGVIAGPFALTPDLADVGQAWDEALTQTRLADLLGPPAEGVSESVSVTDPADVVSGLSQLNRYLGRAWSRAGIAAQWHDDASQAVYVSMLQTLGRDRFDGMLADVGQHGIRDVLSRETTEGPDFFRAIDTVKKRFQRERSYQALDAVDVASSGSGEDALNLWRSALQEAIDQALTPREAALVYATLMGKTPAEIASQWGVAPKTVSNEKTRVIQKLREALVADVD